MQDESLVKLRDQLEYLFLRIIVSGLRGGTLHAPEAKKMAQELLAVEPFASVEDAHNKINNYVATYPSFKLLKEYSDVYYNEDKIDEKLDIMKKHLKDNNVEEALKVINV